MTLSDLNPHWAVPNSRYDAFKVTQDHPPPDRLHGLAITCPGCTLRNGTWRGVSRLILWPPGVPDAWYSRPGRWPMDGDTFHNLTLHPSVLVNVCGCHFFIEDGTVRMV